MPLIPSQVISLEEAVKKLLEIWMRIKLVFLKAFSDAQVQSEQEKAYLQLKTEISRLYKKVSEELPGGMRFDGDKMMESLKSAMTMDHLKNLPANERQKLLSIWHACYLKLSRTLGALEIMNAGYYPHLHREIIFQQHESQKQTRKRIA
jgi:hypothetical protein